MKTARTILSKLLLAATALMPIAASAQQGEQRDRGRFDGARQRGEADGGRMRFQSPRSMDGGPRLSHAPETVRDAQLPAAVQPDRPRPDRQRMPSDPTVQRGWRGGERGDRGARFAGDARSGVPNAQVDARVQPDHGRGNRPAPGFLGAHDDRAAFAGNRGRRPDDWQGDRRQDSTGTPGRRQWGDRNQYREQNRDRSANRADQYDHWRDQQRFAERRDWNRDWRSDNRYDWGRYRNDNRYAYRLPRYYAPQGWGYGYRRFSVGITLNSYLFGENYWIDDPYAYRLPDAYGPYRWVRYYNDALLVDVRYGRVVDVVYGIFW